MAEMRHLEASFVQLDLDDEGRICKDWVHAFFKHAGVQKDIVDHVLTSARLRTKGFLDRGEFFLVLRLVIFLLDMHPSGEYFRLVKDLENKLKEIMKEEAVFQKVASDERSMRIAFEQKANESIALLRLQLSELQARYDSLQSKHDQVLDERDLANRVARDLRQKRDQMLAVLVTALHCEFSSSELEEATKGYHESRVLGSGAFGCVYKGILRDSTVAAVKVLLRKDILQERSQFEQEVAILSKVRHPHLIALLGACSESFTLVYEFLSGGNLEDYLKCPNKRQRLTWQIRIRILAEICSALIFLHKNKPHPIAHGDIKPANILLDAHLVSKLSDFGLSHLLLQCSTNSTNLHRTMHPAGTIGYMDPEFFSTGEMTCRSDVYSFGILVLRLLTAMPTVNDDKNHIRAEVEDAVNKGKLKSIIDTAAGEWPDEHIHRLARLALRCTRTKRKGRPDLSGKPWEAIKAMRDATEG